MANLKNAGTNIPEVLAFGNLSAGIGIGLITESIGLGLLAFGALTIVEVGLYALVRLFTGPVT